MTFDKRSQHDKDQLRVKLRSIRAAVNDVEELSSQIFENLARLPGHSAARTLLFYISIRTEVPTRFALQQAASSNTCRICVPYCSGESLKLVLFEDDSDLVSGKYGIPEPAMELRTDPSRQIAPTEVDLALIPGLGFDRQGNRLGYGAGYYDRFLPQVRRDCLRVALAFDCQIVDEIPAGEHDQRMDWIITPNELIECATSL